MKRKSLGHWMMIVLTSFATVFPSYGHAAGDAPAAQNLAIRDASLAAGGTLRGAVTDAAGRLQANTELIVIQEGKLLAATQTNDKGEFTLRDLRPGVYELNTPKSVSLVRVWADRTAPPSAQSALLVVEGPTVVRAQQWSAWRRALILSGVIITSGVIGGVIGYNVKDDAS